MGICLVRLLVIGTTAKTRAWCDTEKYAEGKYFIHVVKKREQERKTGMEKEGVADK